MISIRADTKANYHEYTPPLFCHCAYSATRQRRGILYSATSKVLGRLRVIRVGLRGPRQLPVYPGERTFPG
jgi:hypothetical protein